MLLSLQKLLVIHTMVKVVIMDIILMALNHLNLDSRLAQHIHLLLLTQLQMDIHSILSRCCKTTEYTTNVTSAGSSSVSIQITETTPSKLYYQCSSHGYMGNCVSVELERSDVTQQEVGHLSGTSSNIQTQLDSIVSSQWTTNGSNEIHFAENVGIILRTQQKN